MSTSAAAPAGGTGGPGRAKLHRRQGQPIPPDKPTVPDAIARKQRGLIRMTHTAGKTGKGSSAGRPRRLPKGNPIDRTSHGNTRGVRKLMTRSVRMKKGTRRARQ